VAEESGEKWRRRKWRRRGAKEPLEESLGESVALIMLMQQVGRSLGWLIVACGASLFRASSNETAFCIHASSWPAGGESPQPLGARLLLLASRLSPLVSGPLAAEHCEEGQWSGHEC